MHTWIQVIDETIPNQPNNRKTKKQTNKRNRREECYDKDNEHAFTNDK